MKRLLIPYDGSPAADSAINDALALEADDAGRSGGGQQPGEVFLTA